MNERIKELMAQAGFDPAAIERMGVMPQAEKFAELIVKECVNVVKEHYDDTLPWGGVEDALEHFGVEE